MFLWFFLSKDRVSGRSGGLHFFSKLGGINTIKFQLIALMGEHLTFVGFSLFFFSFFYFAFIYYQFNVIAGRVTEFGRLGVAVFFSHPLRLDIYNNNNKKYI